MGRSFGEQVADWQASVDHAPTTRYSTGLLCARIVADLGHIELAELNARDLDLWYRRLAGEGMLPNTIRHYHATIRAVLSYACDWDQVDRNVATKAHPPKATKTDETDRVPTPEALAVMLATVTQPTLRTAILLAASTGMRRGELCALRWEDLRQGTLWVHRSAYKVPGSRLGYKEPKNLKPKVIPLNRSMMAELDQLAAWQDAVGRGDCPMILAKSATEGYPPDWLSQEWQRLCKRHGVRYKFHGLRHLHGSLLVDSGVSLTTAAARQGHSVQTMTAHYLHPVNASAQAAADVIEQRLAVLFQNMRE